MSVLKPGVESFLGRFLQSSLDKNWRTPTDFIRHFGPTELIAALADAPEVRSHLLVEAAGVHARIATKKSPESATEDLQIALDEGVATPEMIVALFPADDQARFLPRAKAWSYLTEQPFWSDGRADSVSRVTFVVTTAVEEGLLTLEQVLQSLDLDALVDVLPPPELRAIMRYSLDLGRQGKSVTELGLLELLSMEKLFGFSSVARLWQDLIVELVATPCALNGASGAGRGPEPTSPADKAKKGRSEGSATQSEKAASAKPEGAAALSAEAKGLLQQRKGLLQQRRELLQPMPISELLPQALTISLKKLELRTSFTNRKGARKRVKPNRRLNRPLPLVISRAAKLQGPSLNPHRDLPWRCRAASGLQNVCGV